MAVPRGKRAEYAEDDRAVRTEDGGQMTEVGKNKKSEWRITNSASLNT